MQGLCLNKTSSKTVITSKAVATIGTTGASHILPSFCKWSKNEREIELESYNKKDCSPSA